MVVEERFLLLPSVADLVVDDATTATLSPIYNSFNGAQLYATSAILTLECTSPETHT